MHQNNRLIDIAGQFRMDGVPSEVKALGDGFINDTYTVLIAGSPIRYILQRKNTAIFKDVPGMMSNIKAVTEHLKKKIADAGGDSMREALTVVPAKDGRLYYECDGEYWCATVFIDDSVSYDKADSEYLAECGGRGIGRFQAMLADFEGELVDTLPGFHNIRYRFVQWDKTLAEDPAGRAAEVRDLISEIEARRSEMLDFFKLVEGGQIPLRVTHNDTKIANMLFDRDGNVLCVLDLDTVLRAPCLYDFGDSIRSYTNTGAEDDPEPDRVSMSRKMYDAFLRGYLSEAEDFLTDIEREYLPFSARYITYEQVLRFLMDYIDGDRYYKVKYPEHNLVRTRAQLRLLQSIEYQLFSHKVGAGAVLRKMIESGNISSFILWGPPGVGKTTLAHIVSKELKRDFYTLSAISSGVKELRDVFARAKDNSIFAKGSPILFIDEIHRFSKSQQDALLGAVETGTVTLIGATTENPSFEVITPLLSRCQVFVMKPLEVKDLETLLERALTKDPYLRARSIDVRQKDALFRFSGVNSFPPEEQVVIDDAVVADRLQENISIYDKNGEMHYDIISAFIKSMRGSDPNGAVYWMARMLAGGEDPLFIARRMLILASEDIGLANPNALLLAQATFDAVHKIGMPEARIILSECAIYLATCVKSNSAYMAIDAALALAEKGDNSPVPLHLRNAPTRLMKDLGYSKDYKYAHDFEGNFTDQEFLPDGLSGTVFYEPGNNPRENEIRTRMERLWPKYKK